MTMNKFITFAPRHQASAVCGGRFRTSYVIPTKEGNYSFSKKGLPTNVIPTKESIYSLASLSYNVINNNRFLPFGRNDIVICFALLFMKKPMSYRRRKVSIGFFEWNK